MWGVWGVGGGGGGGGVWLTKRSSEGLGTGHINGVYKRRGHQGCVQAQKRGGLDVCQLAPVPPDWDCLAQQTADQGYQAAHACWAHLEIHV